MDALDRSQYAEGHRSPPERTPQARLCRQQLQQSHGRGHLRPARSSSHDRGPLAHGDLCAQRLIRHGDGPRRSADHRHPAGAHRHQCTIQGHGQDTSDKRPGQHPRFIVCRMERRALRGNRQGHGGNGGVPRREVGHHEAGIPRDDLSDRERGADYNHSIRQTDGFGPIFGPIPGERRAPTERHQQEQGDLGHELRLHDEQHDRHPADRDLGQSVED